MLSRMSSRELTEWKAYEKHAGPLGGFWFAEALSALHEQIQFLNYMFGQAKFTDKQHKKGPAPKPTDFPRPDEMFRGLRKHRVDWDDGGDELVPAVDDDGEDD